MGGLGTELGFFIPRGGATGGLLRLLPVGQWEGLYLRLGSGSCVGTLAAGVGVVKLEICRDASRCSRCCFNETNPSASSLCDCLLPMCLRRFSGMSMDPGEHPAAPVYIQRPLST